MNKKILVLGGTGAMGIYLVPELIKLGCFVHVISLDDVKSDNPQLIYTKGDAKNNEFLSAELKNGYDAIVDFLIYSTEEFQKRYRLLLENTEHYLFLSSYRVYADKTRIITENSPRLLDVSDDAEFLLTEDYSLYKARQENILESAPSGNWTILRPAITFSKFRYQLVTLEADTVIHRAFSGKPIILPKDAMTVQATMTWAGDVAKLISRLILNKKAYGHRFTVATSEHHTWREIAEYYNEICNLQYITVDIETYIQLIAPKENRRYAKWQLIYDRMFNRIVDNSKILEVTGIKQSDFTPIKEALAKEISALPRGFQWQYNPANEKMDEYIENLKTGKAEK